jgi:hypothetical protein
VVVDPGVPPCVVAYIKDGLLIVMALIKTKINSEVAANGSFCHVNFYVNSRSRILTLCIIFFIIELLVKQLH